MAFRVGGFSVFYTAHELSVYQILSTQFRRRAALASSIKENSCAHSRVNHKNKALWDPGNVLSQSEGRRENRVHRKHWGKSRKLCAPHSLLIRIIGPCTASFIKTSIPSTSERSIYRIMRKKIEQRASWKEMSLSGHKWTRFSPRPSTERETASWSWLARYMVGSQFVTKGNLWCNVEGNISFKKWRQPCHWQQE